MRVMRPIDSLDDLQVDSIFLAGPTPRSEEVRSWRPGAIEALEALGFAGDILAPEPFYGDFHSQVEWEYRGLENCRLICFWVPRDLVGLPGFTTNVEFGRYVGSGRIIYGRPPNSPQTKYLDWLYEKITGESPFDQLNKMLKHAINRP